MNLPHVFTFKASDGQLFDREMRDAEGNCLYVGAIVERIDEKLGVGRPRGVITWIGFAGESSFGAPPFGMAGDMEVKRGGGVSTVSNQYHLWRIIPEAKTTMWERWMAWMKTPFEHDPDSGMTPDTALAVSGIMALLPPDIVDWDYGPFPDSLEDALQFIMKHCDNLEERIAKAEETAVERVRQKISSALK